MVLKIFIQPDCPKCPLAKKLGKKLEKQIGEQLKIEYFDTSTVDGLTEASFYSVMSTPSLILCDDQGRETKSWRGQTPSEDEVAQFFVRKFS